MDISLDKFLDGKIKLYQPKKGYRAGIDAVLLAASIRTSKNSFILDIGSGVGAVTYCLAHRCSDVEILGIEKNKDYYLLAKKSIDSGEYNVKIIAEAFYSHLNKYAELKLDYFAISDFKTLQDVKITTIGIGRVLISTAVYIGPVRLIDNIICST